MHEGVERVHVLSTSKQVAIRWTLLLAILTLELIAITARFEVPTLFSPLMAHSATWTAWLFRFSKVLWPAALWVTGASLFMLSPRLKPIFNDLRDCSAGNRWWVWLALHLLVMAAFLALTALIFARPTDPARLSLPWLSSWLALGSTALALWMLALAPGQFWWRLVRQEHTALLMGGLLGIGAWMLIGRLSQYEYSILGQQEFWNSLGMPTLQLVHLLIGWVYSDLIYQPEQFILGTSSFLVSISYACSGIEGIVLITLFLAIYLWLFRKDLRFPQVFWLFPLGITVIWLANAVRIAILIVIGASFSPEIALQGFHAQAGWIAFTLISLGAIALSSQLPIFSVIKPKAAVVRTHKSLAAALLVPFLVLMAISMLTSAFSSGFDWLYPLRFLAVAAVLGYYRHSFRGLGWAWTWEAPAIGTAVFMVWMLLEPDVDSSQTALSQGLAELPRGSAAVWLAFRVLGSVITVPLAEELAFRGYLMRKLIANDFENVPTGQFSWLSFMLSSVLFGLLHERWMAGTLAGMAYALALYRRGRLGDAVIAHMTSNALIAIVVLTQAKWSLWS